ncbi:2-Hydroxyacid oxidase 1-like isoform X2 [Haemaphysalis longicornis]
MIPLLVACCVLLVDCASLPRKTVQDTFVVTMADVQRLAEANLDNATRSYIASGADQERTLKENTEAFSRLQFRPRILVDVSKVNMATTLLGQRISFPVGFSPSATHQIAHPIGEIGTAQAAQNAGTVMILSAMSTVSLEDVRRSAPNLVLWQQIYLFRNRSLTESFVKRATASRYGAIVVTVDSPVAGQAIPLVKNNFRLKEGLRFANLERSSPGSTFTFDPHSGDFIGELLSPSVTWKDIQWLRSISPLPIVAKGVLTADSAREALRHGASAVLVSNHGGRQLDGDPATIEALPEIVAAVGRQMEVYLDSGVRTGADVAKALSLGARAVFVGRPAIWGLAYNGKEGVDKVLKILRDEFKRTIQLLGCPDSGRLNPSFVARQDHYSEIMQDRFFPQAGLLPLVPPYDVQT